jgi:glycerate kinase
MKIVIAPDSLKECLSAPEAADAIARGVRSAAPHADVLCVPIADGGEGTAATLVQATGGELRTCRAPDPLGRPVEAEWGISGDGRTAFVEMARASGLELLERTERDPMATSTDGTGHMIAAALDAGARKLVVGIGGSATVDGGTGMAHALGVRFLNADGAVIERPCGGRLADIEEIDASGLDPRVSGATLEVACDVTNPLTGPEGAAAVYGPQKGASPDQVRQLDSGLAHLAEVIHRCLGRQVEPLPGAGAAGGLGAGLVAFLGAELRRGVETVLDAVRIDEALRAADLAFTAEGAADVQSAFGKATAGVASRARAQGVPCVLLAGSLNRGWQRMYDRGVTAAFALADGPMALDACLQRAPRLLENTAEATMRLWLAGGEVRGPAEGSP